MTSGNRTKGIGNFLPTLNSLQLHHTQLLTSLPCGETVFNIAQGKKAAITLAQISHSTKTAFPDLLVKSQSFKYHPSNLFHSPTLLSPYPTPHPKPLSFLLDPWQRQSFACFLPMPVHPLPPSVCTLSDLPNSQAVAVRISLSYFVHSPGNKH